MNQGLFRKIGIAFALTPLLLLLFIKAQAPDPSKHHRVLSAMNKLESMSSEIEIITIKLRYRLQNYYDGLSSATRETKLILQDMKVGPNAIFHKGNEKIDLALLELEKVLAQKTELVDRFKSHNAVLKNSLHYFPHITEETLAMSRSNKYFHQNLQRNCRRP